MLKFESLPSHLKFRTVRVGIGALCLFFVCCSLLSPAFGQDFQLQADQFNPAKMDPGGTSSVNITMTTLTGFSGSMDLTCQVTSQLTTGTFPVCEISPTSLTSSGGATATVTSSASTTPGLYTMIITGSDSSGTVTLPRDLSVLAVSTNQFTITVTTAVQPGSVHAGSGGQGVISVNPLNGYISPGGQTGVTLYCASITPLVTIPPVCSFTYQPGTQGVVVNGSPNTATITVSTSGPIVKETGARSNTFYGLWLPLPMLALAGLGAAAGGKKTRKAWGVLALFVVSGAFLLMPACGNTTNPVPTSTSVTPKNTYTFTVVGVDSLGNTSSNTGTTGAPTVTLTVD